MHGTTTLVGLPKHMLLVGYLVGLVVHTATTTCARTHHVVVNSPATIKKCVALWTAGAQGMSVVHPSAILRAPVVTKHPVPCLTMQCVYFTGDVCASVCIMYVYVYMCIVYTLHSIADA